MGRSKSSRTRSRKKSRSATIAVTSKEISSRTDTGRVGTTNFCENTASGQRFSSSRRRRRRKRRRSSDLQTLFFPPGRYFCSALRGELFPDVRAPELMDENLGPHLFGRNQQSAECAPPFRKRSTAFSPVRGTCLASSTAVETVCVGT